MTALDDRDAEISRCATCHDWRWRASYLPCQQCGAQSLAASIIPPADLTPRELAHRWHNGYESANRPARVRHPQPRLVSSARGRTVSA